MKYSLKAVAAALFVAPLLAGPARADVVLYQTATLDPNAVANDNTFVLQGDGTTAGNGFSGGSLMFGADFTVVGGATITGIDAAFADTATTASSGAIFGAIVPVDPATGLPTQPVETLASGTLAEVVFTPTTDGDTTLALSVTLPAGEYGVVFGSGLFGATGVADLLAGNDTVGSPSVFVNDFAPWAADPSDTDIRLFVTAAPEPGSLAMLLTAATMLTGVSRRRR